MLSRIAGFLATTLGFCTTLASIILFGALGWPLGWSDVWLLSFNLFLSVFAALIGGIILVAGARDTKALHVKIDELIHAIPGARDAMMGIEALSEEEIAARRARGSS